MARIKCGFYILIKIKLIIGGGSSVCLSHLNSNTRLSLRRASKFTINLEGGGGIRN